MNHAIVIILSIVALEMLFQLTFTRFYFQVGIPIFRRTIKCHFGGKPIPSPDEIEWFMPESRHQQLCFRSLDSSNIGFRERFFDLKALFFHYTPVMHGLLSFDLRRGVISVTGYVNWSTVALIFVFFFLVKDKDVILLFAVGSAAILGIIYGIQAKRFSNVAEVAADLVSSKS
ncbi:MAG: hypothetical protein FWH15_09005 [Betaproteobacteria bacterium]|nr:hypothetical protein [Betaproteobacteria bacterium]